MNVYYLRYKLWRLSLASAPRGAFLSSLGEKLHPVLMPSRAWRVTTVGFVLFAFLVGGTGTYAYVSDSVEPGDVLYGVKRGVESVELELASAVGLKDRVRLRHAIRRANEQRHIIK